MKKITLAALAFALLLTACAAPSQPGTTTVATESPFPQTTATSSQTPSPTRTPTPTKSPTPTITPLPTIPTVTPTFDVHTIVTATPAPKAECPKEDNSVKMDFQFPRNLNDLGNSSFWVDEEMVLAYLNKGGSVSELLNNLQGAYWAVYAYGDFTGDGVNELLFQPFGGSGYTNEFILSCTEGQYKAFWINKEFGAVSGARIIALTDMNKNGMTDIVMSYGSSCEIYEWDGFSFRDIAYDKENNSWPNVHYPTRKPEIRDINHDGFDELILTGADIYWVGYNESFYEGFPWRDEIRIFAWNGKFFSKLPSQYSAPEYRFQAVQDGDRSTLQHDYVLALDFYQSAIFNDTLKWWTPEMHDYEAGIPKAMMNNQPTPTPPTTSDPTEYPRLAAYAYYRMLILHAYLGQMDAAQIQYDTLQSKFPAGNPGHPYVEMTTAFRNAYQASGRMYAGCAAAIQYAAEHPEILTPLGSDYHGWQSHKYVPADVCPFR